MSGHYIHIREDTPPEITGAASNSHITSVKLQYHSDSAEVMSPSEGSLKSVVPPRGGPSL